jgi:hypothetical protein
VRQASAPLKSRAASRVSEPKFLLALLLTSRDVQLESATKADIGPTILNLCVRALISRLL